MMRILRNHLIICYLSLSLITMLALQVTGESTVQTLATYLLRQGRLVVHLSLRESRLGCTVKLEMVTSVPLSGRVQNRILTVPPGPCIILK